MKSLITGILIVVGIGLIGMESKDFDLLFNIIGGFLLLAGLDIRYGEWK